MAKCFPRQGYFTSSDLFSVGIWKLLFSVESLAVGFLKRTQKPDQTGRVGVTWPAVFLGRKETNRTKRVKEAEHNGQKPTNIWRLVASEILSNIDLFAEFCHFPTVHSPGLDCNEVLFLFFLSDLLVSFWVPDDVSSPFSLRLRYHHQVSLCQTLTATTSMSGRLCSVYMPKSLISFHRSEQRTHVNLAFTIYLYNR